MSGPFGSQQWMYSSGFYPHEIDNSARLDSNSYYTRTPSSSSNADTWTWSAWVKNWGVTAGGYLLSSGVSGSREFLIYFDSTNQRLNVYQYNGGIEINVITSMQFRDPSAWYHIVVAVDTTQGTAANRIKIYVNGEQQTDFATATYPAQNLGTRIGTTEVQDIGKNAYNQNVHPNFYIAEVNYISGSQLAPTSFGETKADTWIPKKYTGSYGSHDYYLDFATRATDPLDASGNGNNWGSVNVVATDWMLDSPTNNFATFNPLARPQPSSNRTFSQGNLRMQNDASNYAVAHSTILLPKTGKWVFEVLFQRTPTGASPWTYNSVGLTTDQHFSSYISHGTSTYAIDDHGGSGSQVFIQAGTEQGSHAGFPAGTVVQVFVDRDNNELTFSINGTLQTQTGATVTIPADVDLYAINGTYHNITYGNFGQDSSFAGEKTAQGNTDANGRGDFYYAPPAGYLALCSANLPDPVAAFNPAVNNSPQDHFNTLLWSGDNTTRNFTGVGFTPDFVWIKSRSAAAGHNLFDTVRGASKQLRSNGRGAENTTNEFGLLTAFNSDGFTTTPGSYSGYESGDLNMSGRTYVGWNWKAGGSGVSNSDGSITSTVSANTDAGFSIVTYTGNGSASATVGHGLGVTPAMVIVKCRSDGADEGEWTTAHKGISGQVMFLNQTLQAYNPAVFSTGGVALGNSSAFSFVNGTASVDNSNKSGNTYVAYCFAEVEGFSKFGSYTGNGSADGPFIHTGFRPAFVLWKPVAGSENWEIIDSARDPYNESYHFLRTNLSNAEASGTVDGIDMLSNGFKLKVAGGGWINANGNTFIYTAFAEMPFKYANAR